MLSYAYGLTDLDGGPLGRLHWCLERRISFPSINGLPNASITIRRDEPLAQELLDRKGDVLLKIYLGTTLWFWGELAQGEAVVADEKTLAANFVGLFWRLQKRLTGKSQTGQPFTEIQRNIVVNDLLLQANSETDTGIRLGTLESLDPVSVGPNHYKPVAEIITEIAAAKAPPRSAWENFDVVATTGGVTGKTLTIGGTWQGGEGNANDFQVGASTQGPNAAYRDAVSDGGAQQNGRFVVASGTAMANTVAQIDFAQSAFPASGVTPQSGMSLRMQSISGTPDPFNQFIINAYRALPTGGITVQAIKVVAGVVTSIGSYQSANTLDANTGYALRAQVDDAGNYWVWFAPSGSAFAPYLLTGTDSVLATAGALASGKVGIHDWYSNSTASTRSYTSFFAYDPTAALQSFDFEIVPSEPTADTDVDGVVGAGIKLGSINVVGALGQVQNDVIFEYPGSIRSYRRNINREGLLTAGYGLPQDVTTEGTAVYQDDAAIAAKRRYEEVVPTDVVDPILRQAVVEAHVHVRATPREIITFELSPDAPEFGVDYDLGDIVTARAKLPDPSNPGNWIVDFGESPNNQFRIYGADTSIDEFSRVTTEPKVVEE